MENEEAVDQLDLEIYSGSASGSGEEDLCEPSAEDDCGSGYPTDYQIVDENFSKIAESMHGTLMCLHSALCISARCHSLHFIFLVILPSRGHLAHRVFT